MLSALELSTSAIRLVQVRDRRIVAVESWPVPPGADPVAVLAAAPLPAPLGAVRVTMQDDDLLLRTMVQPPCPPERLDRIVRFELSAAANDADAVTLDWHRVEELSGDFRILALVAKRSLIRRLREALVSRGGSLSALIPTAAALHAAWRELHPGTSDKSVILDVGGARTHLALADGSALLFLRTLQSGLDELVKQVAELRSLSSDDARSLIAKLGPNLPADLRGLIDRQAAQLATTIANNLRYARAQLQLDGFEPTLINLSGAGAQLPGFAAELARRSSMTVRILNPFAGAPLLPALSEDLDRLSALPGAFAPVLGAARANSFVLDGLADERRQRSRFWATQGILRVAAAAAAVLIVLSVAVLEIDARRIAAAKTVLSEPGTGLVTLADAVDKGMKVDVDAAKLARDQLAWLNSERRANRIALELLAAIAAEQDPSSRPAVLKRYKVAREGRAIQVELDGEARAAGGQTADKIVQAFIEGLRRRYPVISAVEPKPRPITAGAAQGFSLLLTIPD